MNEQAIIILRRGVFCALVAGLAATVANAEVRVVPTQYANIRAAVDASFSGDEIVLEDGIYTGPDNREVEVVGKSLRIRGKNGPATSIIDCGAQARAFRVVLQGSQTFHLDGVTIRNGRATFGGAIQFEGGAPNLHDCVFQANLATRDRNALATGGALLFLGSNATIADCEFHDNAGLIGGGIAISGSTASIQRTHFEGHDWIGITGSDRPSVGGAIAVVGDIGPASAEITDCTFVENRADNGGAIQFDAASADISGSLFDGNQAEPGGGYGGTFVVRSSTVNLRNSTIRNAGTEATRLDSGVLNAADCVFENTSAIIDSVGATTSTFVNCRFQRIDIAASAASGSQLRFQNSVFSTVRLAFVGASNSSVTAANCAFVQCQGNAGFNASIAYSVGAGIVISNSIFADCDLPLFEIALGSQPLVRNCISPFPIPGDNLAAPVRFRDPLGADGLAGTSDDDYALLAGAPGIDAARAESMLRDTLDIDLDGDLTERTPIDLGGHPRAADDPAVTDSPLPGSPPRVDIGPYEFQRPCLQDGDVDGDGDVDLTDLCFVLHHFGTPAQMVLGDGDLDRDSDVDLADLATLLTEFGMDCTGG